MDRSRQFLGWKHSMLHRVFFLSDYFAFQIKVQLYVGRTI